jgi:hyperosmotically inducible protein
LGHSDGTNANAGATTNFKPAAYFQKEIMMKSKPTTVLLMLGALAMPAAALADHHEEKNGDSAKTEVKDAMITGKVKAAFAKDKGVSAMNIKVDTDHSGVVTLSGTAKSQAEADRAVELARTVEGVSSVNSKITVGADR